MFNLNEAIKSLYELADEEDRPEIIEIFVTVKPESLEEGLPDKSGTQFDEQTLEEWYDFAATVEGIIDNYCDVVNISLSKNPDSLSEYIDFYSYDENGNKKNYLIDLRLSNHGATHLARETRKRHAKKIDQNFELESIIVNNETFKSYHDAIVYLRKMLAKHLK